TPHATAKMSCADAMSSPSFSIKQPQSRKAACVYPRYGLPCCIRRTMVRQNFDLKTWTDGISHPEPKRAACAALECSVCECRESGVTHLLDRADARDLAVLRRAREARFRPLVVV